MSLWHHHPHVRTGGQLSFGERMADRMKAVFATWTALLGILVGMAVWMATGGFGTDAKPYILLNLCLSCIAALQCFILLIAAKRADQISSELAQHDYEVNTDSLRYHVVQAQVLVMLADAAPGVTLSDEQRKALLAPPTIPLPPLNGHDDEWPAVR